MHDFKHKPVKTICIDFDGVIHNAKDGWKDGSIYGEPMDGVKRSLDKLKGMGYYLVILTSRDDLDEVACWLECHDLCFDRVTNKKVPALAYIDDRAIRFTNWHDIEGYFI